MKIESIHETVKSLNEAQVRYLIVGGLAVVAHNYVRFTAGIDLVVALDADNVSRAMAAFERLGYKPRVPVKPLEFADAAKREIWIREKGMVVFQMTSEQHRRLQNSSSPARCCLEWLKKGS